MALASGADMAQSVCDHATLFIQIATDGEKFRRGQDHAAMVFGNSTYASAIAAAEPYLLTAVTPSGFFLAKELAFAVKRLTDNRG